MIRSIAMVVGVLVSLAVALAWGADFQVTPAMQQEFDKQIEAAKGWAAHPVVVDAVLDQNKKGPIPGMDNPVWKTIPDIEAVVQAHANNQAAAFLKQRIGETNRICTGAFLNAAQGEKVAFTEKTGSYLHKARRSSTFLSAPERPGRAHPNSMTAEWSTRSRWRSPSCGRGSRLGPWSWKSMRRKWNSS